MCMLVLGGGVQFPGFRDQARVKARHASNPDINETSGWVSIRRVSGLGSRA